LEVIADVGWLSSEEVKSEYEESGDRLALFTSIGKGAS
jgi:hypothetical protein